MFSHAIPESAVCLLSCLLAFWFVCLCVFVFVCCSLFVQFPALGASDLHGSAGENTESPEKPRKTAQHPHWTLKIHVAFQHVHQWLLRSTMSSVVDISAFVCGLPRGGKIYNEHMQLWSVVTAEYWSCLFFKRVGLGTTFAITRDV